MLLSFLMLLGPYYLPKSRLNFTVDCGQPKILSMRFHEVSRYKFLEAFRQFCTNSRTPTMTKATTRESSHNLLVSYRHSNVRQTLSNSNNSCNVLDKTNFRWTSCWSEHYKWNAEHVIYHNTNRHFEKGSKLN